SIYSASELAKKEFPDKDATVRGAVSIARRFQDPLAELVKIDPKSIGVGQYQHDVNQSRLKKSLTGVVEDCVNFVGVDLNTASAPLLSYVSGIGATLAANIVKKREELGGFKERAELLNVSRFSQKIFEQSGGFLRIYGGKHPLDATFIHPERYGVLEDWVKENGLKLKDLVDDSTVVEKLAQDSTLVEKIGEFTHTDIVKALRAPSQDPRTEFKSTEFKKGVRKLSDLVPGQWYTGIVTNITQFGAFVDVGIKENGLVHVSEMADHFVSNALEVLKVGEEVKARVIEVDHDRGRISLSLKTGESVATSKSPRPQGGRSNQQQKIPTQKDAPIKNNAFASLKNFKVK
ncbi:MAG: helix-hairpin-helix domain-containing protein, partial [Bacteriovoracaceae bacterium]|nr:helix-hairpin-helix domain-containing protein [Bacteriovoracaceae bacterium]